MSRIVTIEFHGKLRTFRLAVAESIFIIGSKKSRTAQAIGMKCFNPRCPDPEIRSGAIFSKACRSRGGGAHRTYYHLECAINLNQTWYEETTT